MMQYGVGVRVERTIELKRIDLDYFQEMVASRFRRAKRCAQARRGMKSGTPRKDPKSGEMFDLLVQHLTRLADEVEKAMRATSDSESSN